MPGSLYCKKIIDNFVFYFSAANMLANLSVLITYEHFITFGLIAAIPASAVCDIYLNETQFSDMKLTGIIFICCGFILVLTPSNIISLLRKPLKYAFYDNSKVIYSPIYRWKKQIGNSATGPQPKSDVRTGYIESRLRSPSGRVR